MRRTAKPAVRRSSSSKRRNPVNLVIPLLLVLAGLGVLLYPVLATQFNNFKQQQFALNYNNAVSEAPSDKLAKGLERARAYNAKLSGMPVLDPYLTDVSNSPESRAYRDYMSQLSDFDAMATLRVPAADIELPVFHGTSDDVLAAGVGHLYGTALPVGGIGTHAVMTSHTALSNATLFDNLSKVEVGDTFFVDVYGDTLAYEVDDITIVEPHDIDNLTPVEGKDLVTLFTCYPYAINSHRKLVTGHRIPYDPAVDTPAHERGIHLHMQDWMWGVLAGAGAVVLLVVAIAAREKRLRRRARLARRVAPRRASGRGSQSATGQSPAPPRRGASPE